MYIPPSNFLSSGIYIFALYEANRCVCVYVYDGYDEEKVGGGVKGFCGNYKNPFSQYIGHSRKRTEYGRMHPPISLVYIL